MVRHRSAAQKYFRAGDYTKALSHYARCEAIALSIPRLLPPGWMLDKALCHQALEQDDEAVGYMNLIWERIRDSEKLNADEKAYVFLYMSKRAEPFFLTVKSIPPGYDTFLMKNVREKLRRRFVIPEVEELVNAPPHPRSSQRAD